jgi:hypothetical protein
MAGPAPRVFSQRLDEEQPAGRFEVGALLEAPALESLAPLAAGETILPTAEAGSCEWS